MSESIERVLAEQGYLLRPIEGDSMMPLLEQTTDLVKLIPAPPRLKQYDLPLYRRPNGALVLHRIVKVKRKHYIICGDNRTRYERVPHAWVIALAVGRYRGGEYLDFDEPAYQADIKRLCQTRGKLLARLKHFVRRVRNRLCRSRK